MVAHAGPERSRRRRSGAGQQPAHLRRLETWNGLRRGDPVEIDGISGRGLTWVFQAHVTNTRNGTVTVEVLGGRPGQQHLRSFLPSQVFPVGGRRRGTPSLEDAPQLPLN
jgi:hypothetical protein